MNRQGIGMMVVWIFVMVAGAAILMLFALIATSQAQAGKDRLEAQALQQVSVILATQATGSDTVVRVPVPKEQLRLTCEPIDDTFLSQLEVGRTTRSLQYDLVAGRDLLTDELLLFSKPLRMPYDIGSALMVSSDEEILLVHADPLLSPTRFFNNSLPAPVKRRIANNGPWPDTRNYQNVRSVLVSNAAPSTHSPSTFPGGSAQASLMLIQLTLGQDWSQQGTIHFYDSTGQRQRSVQYNSNTMLLGLIWQGGASRAECFERKVSYRLQEQTVLQIQRLRELQSTDSDRCPGAYNTAQLDNLLIQLQSEWDNNYWSRVHEATRQVEAKNRQVLHGTSCATIY
jgi:hypothetical protein